MKFTFQQEKERISITLFLVFCTLYALFGEPDFAISDYSKLYISQATRDNVDISERVSLFYRAIISALVLLPLFYSIIRRITVYYKIHQKKLEFPAITSITGLILLITDVMGIENNRGIELFLYLTIIGVVLSWLSTQYQRLRILGDGAIFAGSLTISIPLISGIILLFNSGNQIPKNIIAWYLLSSFIIVIIIFYLSNKGIRLRKLWNYLLPVSFIPIILFISIECLFYFEINHEMAFHYKNWFVIFFVSSSLIYYLTKQLRPNQLSFNHLFVRYFAPAAILSYVILVYYFPIINHPEEFFELANPAISQLRIFQFGEIPFVDFMSSHMFSEQFYGLFYHLFHGYNGTMDFYVYNFLYIALFYILAYHFLIRFIKSPFLSLLILLTFPFVLLLFSTHLFFGALVFFATKRLLIKQSSSSYFLLFIALIGLVIWRLDTGASTILASTLFIPLAFYTEKTKIAFLPLLKGAGLFSFLLFVLVFIFSLLRSPQLLWSNFKAALHYITANQAHGYSDISRSFDQQFYIYHFLLPALSVVLICAIIYYLRAGKFTNEPDRRYALLASLFFYLIFIMNFQRGLVRHGFMEQNDHLLSSTFFLATVLLLYSIVKWKNSFSRYSTFFGIAFILIILLKYFPLSKGASPLQTFLKEPAIATLNEQRANPSRSGRLIVNGSFKQENYIELKAFLDSHLKEDQTFLNFSSKPMLYYYCQRRVPAYFCQNQQNTVDDYLQLNHLSYLNPEYVPVALMPSSSQLSFLANSSDGILNDMRQYMIAEFIYKNYTPLKEINNQVIWVSNSIDVSDIEKETQLTLEYPVMHFYAHIASAMDNHFFQEEKSTLKLIKTALPTDGDENLDIYTIDKSARGEHIFLRLYVENPIDDREVEFAIVDTEGRSISNTSFTCKEGQKTYTVLLSNRYLWYNRTPKRIRIPVWSGMVIKKVEFYKDERTDSNYR